MPLALRAPTATSAREAPRLAGRIAALRAQALLPVDALPLDLFRVLVGVITFFYFLSALQETTSFSAVDGLIDHSFVARTLWFTRMGLFGPWLSVTAFQVVYGIGCALSVAVVVGFHPRLAAALLYLLAVSTYRWNFLVTYVDDGIVHLALLWLVLLPVGRTCVLGEWLSLRRTAWERWTTQQVPGLGARALLVNLFLVYVVAGTWKLTSPMWRDGTALAVVLQLPIARWPLDAPALLPLLRVASWAALLFELVVPLAFVLPAGHWLRRALLSGLVLFHGTIVLTLDIPFANLICMAAAVVVAGPELMSRVRRGAAEVPVPGHARLADAVAVGVVLLLVTSMVLAPFAPEWRAPASSPAVARVAEAEWLGPQRLTVSLLWILGLAQQYRLLDWIDDRNVGLRYEVVGVDAEGRRQVFPERSVFPRGMRHTLLHANLHGVTWVPIPSAERPALRTRLSERLAARFCRTHEAHGDMQVEVSCQVWRIDPRRGAPPPSFSPWLSFRCSNGRAESIALSAGGV